MSNSKLKHIKNSNILLENRYLLKEQQNKPYVYTTFKDISYTIGGSKNDKNKFAIYVSDKLITDDVRFKNKEFLNSKNEKTKFKPEYTTDKEAKEDIDNYIKSLKSSSSSQTQTDTSTNDPNELSAFNIVKGGLQKLGF
jgi:hypothetical protein